MNKKFQYLILKIITSLLLSHAFSSTLYSQCNFKTIGCGFRHTIAIDQNGKLWAWGKNEYGQLGTGDFQDYNRPVLVSSDTNWVLVSAKGNFSLALKRDGSVWATGFNEYGQLGIGSDRTKGQLTRVSSNVKFKYISTSENGSAAVGEDGSLYLWGYFTMSYLGRNSDTIHRPFRLNFPNEWDKIEPSSDLEPTFIGLKKDGTIWSWGRNNFYKLGLGMSFIDTTIKIPIRINLNAKIVKIQNGPYSCLALTSDGSLYSWGDNPYGELGNNQFYEPNLTPKIVGKPSEWKDCASSGIYTPNSAGVKKDGTLWLWGSGEHSQYNDPEKKRSNVPEQIGILNHWNNCYLGWQVCFASDQTFNLYAWGESVTGKLGLGSLGKANKPTSLCCTPIRSVIDTSICMTDTFVLNGKKYHQGRSNGLDSLKSIQGCDSVVVINVKFIQVDSTLYYDTACYNDRIIINGMELTKDRPSANISLKKQGILSCDSIVTVLFHFTDSLFVNDSIFNENNESKIKITPVGGTPPYSQLWSTGETSNTIVVNNKDTYQLTVTDSRGCSFVKVYYFGINSNSMDDFIPITYYIKDQYLNVVSELFLEKIELYSIMGQRHISVSPQENRLYLGDRKNTIWICKLTTTDNRMKVFKFFY